MLKRTRPQYPRAVTGRVGYQHPVLKSRSALDLISRVSGTSDQGENGSEPVLGAINISQISAPNSREAVFLKIQIGLCSECTRRYAPNICPPSTLTVCPVIQPASGEQRNSTRFATSSGRPMRPNGMLSRILL